MSEDKHTAGPWFIGHGDVYAKGNKASDFDDRVICAIGRGGERAHEYATVPAHKPEGRANARLIAAAPLLLKALEDLYALAEEELPAWWAEGPISRARAAIEAATGEAK